jgi:hypothetical protein
MSRLWLCTSKHGGLRKSHKFFIEAQSGLKIERLMKKISNSRLMLNIFNNGDGLISSFTKRKLSRPHKVMERKRKRTMISYCILIIFIFTYNYVFIMHVICCELLIMRIKN